MPNLVFNSLNFPPFRYAKEPDAEFDSYLYGPAPVAPGIAAAISSMVPEIQEVPLIVTDENTAPQPGPTMPTTHVIKSLIKYLSQESPQPLWNYEDITAKGCWGST